MKFSDVPKEQWEELAPYMDTVLLPVTGMTGKESPWEATEALERLRDTMEDLEKRFVGRLVTYPAFHYIAQENGLGDALGPVCRRLREEAGFAFVILITADPVAAMQAKPEGADLFFNTMHVQSGQAVMRIGELWAAAAEPSEEN